MYTRALISSARTNNFKFKFLSSCLSLCHAHNLQLHITTDEEAAASKRMVFYDFYVFQRKKNNIYLVSLTPDVASLWSAYRQRSCEIVWRATQCSHYKRTSSSNERYTKRMEKKRRTIKEKTFEMERNKGQKRSREEKTIWEKPDAVKKAEVQ